MQYMAYEVGSTSTRLRGKDWAKEKRKCLRRLVLARSDSG